MKVGEIMGRVIKQEAKERKPLPEIIREWFIKRGWRLSESGRAVHRYMPVYGIKDEPVDVKVFINLTDGRPWGRYYGPDIRKDELRKLRKLKPDKKNKGKQRSL